jgi:hypothetical protein
MPLDFYGLSNVWCARVENITSLIQYALCLSFFENWVGWLVLCRINSAFPQLAEYADLELDFEARLLSGWIQVHYSVLGMKRGNVDYLLMAMLVATSAFENPPPQFSRG